MRFTLQYKGPLRAAKGPEEKHRIRRALHPQLRNLWAQVPLDGFKGFLEPRDPPVKSLSVLRSLGSYTFAPLVCQELHLLAELDILLLRPEAPGRVITSGGDIDNRLKTLFDALSMPSQTNALPARQPDPDEVPLFCLLESDSLISKVSVDTDTLLDNDAGVNDVSLTIRVQTRQLRVLMGTIGL